MILELLQKTLNENQYLGYEISEFQLGQNAFHHFKIEASEFMPEILSAEGDVYYSGIPIKPHKSKDAIMFCVKIK